MRNAEDNVWLLVVTGAPIGLLVMVALTFGAGVLPASESCVTICNGVGPGACCEPGVFADVGYSLAGAFGGSLAGGCGAAAVTAGLNACRRDTLQPPHQAVMGEDAPAHQPPVLEPHPPFDFAFGQPLLEGTTPSGRVVCFFPSAVRQQPVDGEPVGDYRAAAR